MNEPIITIGIKNANKIALNIVGEYYVPRLKIHVRGSAYFESSSRGILFESTLGTYYINEKDIFIAANEDNASFWIHNVKIGKGFHWEREEDQHFLGEFKFVKENGGITLVNIIPMELYLESVIGSEMSENASPALLESQAVVARSWTLAQLKKSKENPSNIHREKGEKLVWHERNSHTLYDFCADDHCQRYQGIKKTTALTTATAIDKTRGIVLMYEDEICDTRYSKSCGGISELYENVWSKKEHPCIESIYDFSSPTYFSDFDLRDEVKFRKWVRSSPEAFCNTNDEKILKQVLVDFDQETKDFFRWKKELSQDKLSSLIHQNLHHDFGEIIDLIPVARGKSGRIIKLKIVGTKRRFIIGKELEIRKTLSDNHLYSSAFFVEKQNVVNNIPQKFVLHGAGWGHGVGLCQIGAAVMGEKGYQFDEILEHYFPHARIKRIYK
jgi:SpoIID/LytB domain protein